MEEWNHSININLTGIFLLTKTLLSLLKKGTNASIVNISSMSSERAGGSIAYCTSGDYTQEAYDKWSEDKKKLYPLGRIGDAKKDIAPTIEFLLSDKSLWTTGAIYLVDGGKSV